MARTTESRASGVLAAGLSAALYAAACLTPALHFVRNGSTPESYPGSALIFLGALAALIGNFAWLANAFYASSLMALILKRWGLASLLAGAALAFSMLTLQLFGAEYPVFGSENDKIRLVALGPGFYLWVASMVVAGLAGIWRRLGKPPAAEATAP